MSISYIEKSDLVVHHLYKVKFDDLLRICITKSHSSPILYWSDGIVFNYEPVPPIMSTRIEEDFVKGKDHWSEVYYSPMEKYTDTIEMDDGDFRGAKIRVIDASNFSPHSDFAKWARPK